MFNPFNYFDIMNSYMNFFHLNKSNEKKIDHNNAKYRVTKLSTLEEVYYSNADCAKKAEEEAWKAFNIYDSKVKKGFTKVNVIVDDNPYKKTDDDGYDIFTGIQDPNYEVI